MQGDLFGEQAGLRREASISPCGDYRWWLGRTWGPGALLVWVMLNPSVADADRDDPTLLRITAFSRRWGYGGLRVVNLYPFRSPRPAVLSNWLAGPASAVEEAMRLNREAVRTLCPPMGDVIAAWGAGGGPAESAGVMEVLAAQRANVRCLGLTAAGAPTHPLARGRSRVPDDVVPRAYSRA